MQPGTTLPSISRPMELDWSDGDGRLETRVEQIRLHLFRGDSGGIALRVSRFPPESVGGGAADAESPAWLRAEDFSIEYRWRGKDFSTKPIWAESFVQHPVAIVRHSVPSDVGLELESHVQGEDARLGGGLTVDFRIRTRETLDRVSLTFRITIEGAAPRTSRAAENVGGFDLVDADGAGYSLWLDEIDPWATPEEHPARSQAAGHSHGAQVFQRPLEKGVILVARLGIKPLVDAGIATATYRQWLDQPSSL